MKRLTGEELESIETNITGRGALLVPSTGIVDYWQVAAAMADIVGKSGGEIRLGINVTGIREMGAEVEVTSAGEGWRVERLAKLS